MVRFEQCNIFFFFFHSYHPLEPEQPEEPPARRLSLQHPRWGSYSSIYWTLLRLRPGLLCRQAISVKKPRVCHGRQQSSSHDPQGLARRSNWRDQNCWRGVCIVCRQADLLQAYNIWYRAVVRSKSLLFWSIYGLPLGVILVNQSYCLVIKIKC